MIYITVTYMLNIEKCVFTYKYTFPMIVHTYILVYTLNMQKRYSGHLVSRLMHFWSLLWNSLLSLILSYQPCLSYLIK